MFLQSRRNENPAIARRREEEDRLRHFQNTVDVDKAFSQRANWESNMTSMMKSQKIAMVAKNIENGEQEKLQQRRQRLALLLASDDELYRNELAGLHETSADKAKRMVRYARQLKEKRESERQAFAQEMFNKQWREGCDDLRMIETNRFAQQCNEEIAKQRTQKLEKRAQVLEDEARWADLWEKERQKKISRDEEEARNRQAFNYETKMALQAQMEQTRQRKEQEAQDQENLRLAFAAQMEEDARIAAEKQAELAEQKRRHIAKITAFNDATLEAKRVTKQRQTEMDAMDLKIQMAQFQQEEGIKLANKAKMREDMFQYQAYLRARKEEEAAMDKELERLVNDEMDRANAKRDMQWMRERLAREQLLKDVYDGRQQQVKQKEAQRFFEEQQLARERDAIEKEIAKAKYLQEHEDDEEREKQAQRAGDLQKQIQANQHREKIREAEKLSSMQSALEAERQYRAFIQRERRRAETMELQPKYFGRKQEFKA